MNPKILMKRALKLSLKGKGFTSPNPWVGCVIEKEGVLIGEGYHKKWGGAHAEVEALKNATQCPKGSTMFVTLEPCSHFGKTPPCTDAIIDAGVKRVYISQKDPDPRVNGNGVSALRAAGIEVIENFMEEEGLKTLAPYLLFKRKKRAHITVKCAISLDGKVAAEDGSSKWISTKEALIDAHKLRRESDAVMVGATTCLKDLPSLTVRRVKTKKQPLAVLLDSKGRVSSMCPLFEGGNAHVFTSSSLAQEKINLYKSFGLGVTALHEQKGHLPLDVLAETLQSMGVINLLIEAGPNLFEALFTKKLIDRLILYVGPRILGRGGIPFCFFDFVHKIDNAPHLTLLQKKQLGDSVRLDYMANFSVE